MIPARKKGRAFALLVCLASALWSCEERDDGRALMLLFDVSGSAAADLQAQYLSWAQSIVAPEGKPSALGPGDVLILGKVGQGSLSQSDVPRIEIPRRSESANRLMADAKTREAVASAREQLERFLADAGANPAPRSEILDALLLAANVLQALNRPRRSLVLFSDMIEESERLDFSRIDLGDDRIVAIVQSERDAGRLPDLSGVEVWIAGAGAGEYARKLGSSRLLAIQSFWVKYFEATGATFERERYLPTFVGLGRQDP